MNLFFLDIVDYCVSQGYVTKKTYIIGSTVAAISGGILSTIISCFKYKKTFNDLIHQKDSYYASEIYSYFRGDNQTPEGVYFYEKTLRNFRQDSIEIFLYSMFKDYITFKMSFECFEARMQRIYKNLDTTCKFSDDESCTLRTIIEQSITVPINDREKYYNFLGSILKANTEKKVERAILEVTPFPRSSLIKWNISK